MTVDSFDWGAAFDRAKGARPSMRRAAVVGAVVGFDLFNPSSYHEIVDNPGKVVSQAAKDVSHPDQLIKHTAQELGPIIDAAKMVASNAIGLVSLIPGIGTGVAGALSAGLAVLEGGSPLDMAIRTAYGVLPIPPGVKNFTDIVLDGVLALLDAGGNLGQAAVLAVKSTLLKKIPDFAKGIATQAFDTLAHLVLQAVSGKPTVAAHSKSLPAVHVKAIQLAHAKAKPLPPHVTPVPPTSKAHLAIHIGLALKKPPAPPPGAPPDLAALVRTQAPKVTRSTVHFA
jgi:hypothetical protein